MLPQWHVQNPGYSAKSAGGKLHLNLHTPLTHLTAVQAECENLLGNELTRNSPGNNRLRSYHLAEPLWTDRGLKSGISLRELISSLKKKKKRRRGINCRTFSQNPRTPGKSHQSLIQIYLVALSLNMLRPPFSLGYGHVGSSNFKLVYSCCFRPPRE